jgi:hypothetical protein
MCIEFHSYTIQPKMSFRACEESLISGPKKFQNESGNRVSWLCHSELSDESLLFPVVTPTTETRRFAQGDNAEEYPDEF